MVPTGLLPLARACSIMTGEMSTARTEAAPHCQEIIGVEAGAASEFEDAGVGDVGGEGGADVFVFDEGDGFFADVVVGSLDGVVLG